MSRQLVVTADDLGMDAGTNEAIVDLLRRGVLTSTTLMTVAHGAADAVARIRAARLASPRLHVTLTSARELRPWRPLAADVPTLTDTRGRFHVDPARLAHMASPAEVAREMAAQLGWMHRSGLRPQALDSHSGSLYGSQGVAMMSTAMDFCAEHGLGFRLPRRLPRLLDLGMRGRLRRRYEAGVTAADARGVRLPETMIGAWLPGRVLTGYAHLRASVLSKLRHLPDGVSELILHPAPPASVRGLERAEGRKRVWELRLLRDPRFLRTIHREGIELVPRW